MTLRMDELLPQVIAILRKAGGNPNAEEIKHVEMGQIKLTRDLLAQLTEAYEKQEALKATADPLPLGQKASGAGAYDPKKH
jgi:hypothetical protein